MGLSKVIEDAFIESLGIDDAKTGRGKIPVMAKKITDGIIDFLQQQTFTITDMKAILEVEKINTAGPINGDVLSTVTTAVNGGNTGAPGPVVGATGQVNQGKNGVTIPPLVLRKSPEPGVVPVGGTLTATGHAYIGKNPVTAEGGENTTKVKLLTIKDGTR